MPYGMGDLLAGAINPGMNDQLARALTPNPGPLPQQEQAPPPGQGQPAPQPNLAPPAVTQPDPANGNLVGLLLKDAQMARAAEGFNRGTAEMASAFGTAQQQASKKAALGGGGGAANPLGDISAIQAIQQEQTDQNEHARFMANMQVLAKVLFPGDPDGLAKATEVAQNKGLLGQMGGAAAENAKQSGTVKDFNTAKADLTESLKRANPNMSDADIAAAVDKRMPPDLLLSSVGGNPEDAAYYQYAALERAAGRTPMDPLAWKEQHTVKATEDLTRTKDSTEFKDQAIQDYEKVNEKLSTSEAQVDRLLKSIPDTMTALKTPDQLTSGQGIAIAKDLPVVGGLVKSFIAPSDTTTALAADIRTLKSSLAATALSEFKNVRNRQEFDTIGKSLTAGLDAANSPEAVQRVLEEAKQRFAIARINAKAAAGRELSPEEAPLANPDYLKPILDNGEKNPYFTGATVAKSPAPTSPSPTVRRRHYNEKGELVDQ